MYIATGEDETANAVDTEAVLHSSMKMILNWSTISLSLWVDSVLTIVIRPDIVLDGLVLYVEKSAVERDYKVPDKESHV